MESEKEFEYIAEYEFDTERGVLFGMVDIAGIPYRIEMYEGLMVDIQALGCIQYEHQIIRIDPSLPPERMAQTIMHEIVHGILYESGYDEHDEETVNRISMTLWRFISKWDGDFGKKLELLTKGVRWEAIDGEEEFEHSEDGSV